MGAQLQINPLTIFIANSRGEITDTIDEGDQWKIYWTTHNTGDDTAPAHTEVVSIHEEQGGGHWDWRYHVRDLAPGDAEVVEFNVGAAETLTAGDYTVMARLAEGAGGETHTRLTIASAG